MSPLVALRWLQRRWAARRRRPRLGIALACTLGALWWWHTERVNLKRRAVVRPGVLLRVGQPTEVGLRRLVWHDGVRTVLSTQLREVRLYRHVWDWGQPDGDLESAFVRRLGALHCQWPMGDEACWPWPAPWQFEAFFHLLDDPSHWPVALHCQGGRHRTGTLAALFRLEYDRWPVERALAEMYAFDYGPAVPLCEHNLRTYLPRPVPTADEWTILARELSPLCPAAARHDYAALVRELGQRRYQALLESRLDALLSLPEPFAVCLAQRLIASADDPLLVAARQAAAKVLTSDAASSSDWAMSAALIADFGADEEQAALAAQLRHEDRTGPPSPRYLALAAGVLNRYTANRQPYWQILLDDERAWPERSAGGSRVADSAVARLAVTQNQDFLGHDRSPGAWDQARARARTWLTEHTGELHLARLAAPWGREPVQAEVRGRHHEDLSRLR